MKTETCETLTHVILKQMRRSSYSIFYFVHQQSYKEPQRRMSLSMQVFGPASSSNSTAASDVQSFFCLWGISWKWWIISVCFILFFLAHPGLAVLKSSASYQNKVCRHKYHHLLQALWRGLSVRRVFFFETWLLLMWNPDDETRWSWKKSKVVLSKTLWIII